MLEVIAVSICEARDGREVTLTPGQRLKFLGLDGDSVKVELPDGTQVIVGVDNVRIRDRGWR